MEKSVLVINDYGGYDRPFTRLGLKVSHDISIFKRPETIAAVCFTGGEDVSPALYGHPNSDSYCNPKRDEFETAVYRRALGLGLPLVGICRGAQLLCVMAGGKLIQDVTGHGGFHPLTLWDGREVEVNSTHHQMQYPWNLSQDEYQVLGYSPRPLSRHYLFNGIKIGQGEANHSLKLEPDIVYYPKIKALAMQYHPEVLSSQHPGAKLCSELLLAYIFNDEKRTTTAQSAS